MKQFDLIFENALRWLNETNGTNYVESNFFDNVYALIKLLSSKNNNYLINNNIKADDEKSVIAFTQNVIKQETPEIMLDTNPPIKIIPSQVPDTEDFVVEIINLKKDVNDKERSQKFTNTHRETIFNQIIDFITNATIQEASPEAAVDNLPPAEGAQAQPGAEQSQLPKG